MYRKEFYEEINNLTEHHRKNCKPYDDVCNGLAKMKMSKGNSEGPFLPVSVFKSLKLLSVPEEQIRSLLTSSGTTGQQVSRIFLDGETAAAQQRALCDIVGEYIGEKRIPMLIIDSPDVLRDRSKYSARGAGIMGFSMMASKRYYALDTDMHIDIKSIKAFAEAAAGGSCFAFGFTYMIWQYFCQKDISITDDIESLKNAMRSCYLIHGGGWKKLQSEAVSNEVFKARLNDMWGIEKVSNYYGMAEQTGSIFMECEEGHLHVSRYSDIHILDPEDFSECDTGDWGLIALDSLLPKSYPGHRILTEDWGRILGEDDCPCGRKGKYFEISGRIRKSEIRGCSDTFAADSKYAGTDKHIKVLAGSEIGKIHEKASSVLQPFDELILDFLEELSAVFTREKKYRAVPEIYSLGFWCRKAHIEKLKARQEQKWEEVSGSKHGKGMVLHITPSNMPTMFAYSWISSLMAGCNSVVRISGRDNNITAMILDGIISVLDKEKYAEIKEKNTFVQFEHDDEILGHLSSLAKARIIWGGDNTVEHICSIPKAEGCIDITFPDKYSIAVLDADMIQEQDEYELKHQVHLFYNDTYAADQNACSSPKIIFWRGEKYGQDRWWNALSKEAENYDLEPWMAMEKYRILCTDLAEYDDTCLVKNYGNRLYVCSCKTPDLFGAKMGLFFEYQLDALDQLNLLPSEKIQTVVSNIPDLQQKMINAKCRDVDRVVSVGEALDFDTIWDRKDLIDILSE